MGALPGSRWRAGKGNSRIIRKKAANKADSYKIVGYLSYSSRIIVLLFLY